MQTVIRINPSAAPDLPADRRYLYVGNFPTEDALVQFVYGNQGYLFVEDAQVFRMFPKSSSTKRTLVISKEGTCPDEQRVWGSWEDEGRVLGSSDVPEEPKRELSEVEKDPANWGDSYKGYV